ncbi:hypothetical protein C8R44DRAFT_785340 [Mycena epipterygia]|nr:hypothetical protein C8R44DRAFT_785340 [Mycena epipterygia]
MDVPMGTRKPAPLPPRRPPHQRLENTDRRDEMEVERELPVEKPIPPARLPPPQVNAVASSSRVQLSPTSSRWLLSSPVVQQTPWQTPLHAQTSGTSRRQPSTSPHTRRSPSPLDWGSPVTGEALESPANTRIGATSSAKSSPTKTYAGRPREASSPSKPRTTPPPIEIVARSDRRSLPRHDFGSSPPSRARADIARTGASLAIPRLSFTENRFDNTPPNWSTRRSRDRNFIGSVEEGRPERRSRAPSPRTDSTSLHYRLLSPRHAGPSHPRSSTPLATKAKRRAPEPGFMPVPKHPDDDARRHSFPASFLPRVDFNRMRITAPRQSLPPPPPPRREPLPQRHGSLFTPRTPTSAPVSANASPARPRISANDRALVEHLGLQQAINAMAANHRFDTEVVRNVYAASGDLAETDKILLRMRERAEEAGLAALRELTGGRAEEDEYEAPLVLRHRRQRSGATATAASSPRSASSSQRKKRQSDGAFRPQPQTRDVLAETKYTPPTSSRAGGFIRLAKKGRVEEGLMRERRRASGGGTLSAFERDVRMQMRPDMEDDVPRTPPPLPQFTAFASGDEAVLRELERRDVGLSMARTADVARFMLNGSVPSPYR